MLYVASISLHLAQISVEIQEILKSNFFWTNHKIIPTKFVKS